MLKRIILRLPIAQIYLEAVQSGIYEFIPDCVILIENPMNWDNCIPFEFGQIYDKIHFIHFLLFVSVVEMFDMAQALRKDNKMLSVNQLIGTLNNFSIAQYFFRCSG